jgi:beta-xylosidase
MAAGRKAFRRWWQKATRAALEMAALGTALGAIIAMVSARPALAISSAPVYSGDFPDPFILTPTASGTGSYWAYSTGSAGRNLQVMSSPDLATWGAVSDPLPTLPKWASPGSTWAPSVLKRGSSFLMYYTVRDTASGRQCISVAKASTPAGPFSDSSSGPLVCQLAHGGSIDPDVFVAPGGKAYLLWKSDDNALGRPTSLWTAQLSSTGRRFVGGRTRLLTEDAAWQAPVIEGPSMVAVGGRYYLFYGANRWNSSAAGIGYATCSRPLGPCSDASLSGPWMASHGAAVGPSGPAVFADSTGVHLAYHAWSGAVGYANGGVRSLWIDALTFRSGVPTVR